MRKLLLLFLLIGITVQSQGLHIGVIAESADVVSGNPYTIDFATDDNIEFSIVSQVTFGYDVEGNIDGDRFYVQDATAVSEYTYTAGDVSTAVYQSPDKPLNAGGGSTRGFIITDNGTKAYSSNYTERQDRYSLSTAWDLSTMSASNQNHIMTDEVANIDDIEISTDGTKYYLMAEEKVWQYTMSTPWDLTTETYDSVNLDLTGFMSAGQGTAIEFSQDGTKFLAMKVTGIIYQYSLSTPWDLSTATYDSVTLDVSAKDPNMWGLSWTNNGTKLLVQGYGNDKVYQYSVN